MWKTTQGLWGARDVKPTSPSLHCVLCAHTCHHQSLSFQAASSRPPFLHGPQATDPSTQSVRPLTAPDHTLPAPAFTFFFLPGPCLKSSIPFPNPSLQSLVQVQQHHVDLKTMPVRTALSPPIKPHLLLGATYCGQVLLLEQVQTGTQDKDSCRRVPWGQAHVVQTQPATL